MTQHGFARSTRARIFAGLGGALILSMLVTGCAPLGQLVPETGESARQASAFPAVYDQTVSWEECGTAFDLTERHQKLIDDNPDRAAGMRCAWVDAPLDWNDAASDATISLAVVHMPSTGEQPIGSLLSNPGGPGGSGFTSAIGQALSPVFAEVREHYDFVGFDPRGMLRSTPVVCDSETNIRELLIAQCDAANELAASMGTTQIARDMDLLRHLMGDERLNYTGYSYGTTIGASYATLFPERVGRIMLDSAWPSDWSSPLGTFQQNEAQAYAVDALLKQCSAEFALSDCPVRDQVALLEMTTAFNNAPEFASDGTPVTGGHIQGYLTASLYQGADGRAHTLEVMAKALAGEQSAIDEIAESTNGSGVSVGGSGMIVRCLSSPLDANLAGVYDYIQEHGMPVLFGGPEISDATLARFMDLTCDALPNKGADHLRFENTSDETILVIGVTGDHATPYEGAVQLVDELDNARLLTLDGPGHIAAFESRSSCIDTAAVNFLVRGELPPAGTVCTDD